jgi:hypothetical protein
MKNALVRFGLSAVDAADVLSRARIDPSVRPEQLGLPEFAELVKQIDE